MAASDLTLVPKRALTILALVQAEYVLHGRVTARAVAAHSPVGLTATYRTLRWLADHDLIAWERGKQGTMRPLYRFVRLGTAG